MHVHLQLHFFQRIIMAKLLFLCPSHRDRREIPLLQPEHEHTFFFHDYASLALENLVSSEPMQETGITDPRVEIANIIEKYAPLGIDGVVSTDDYPGSTLASIVAAQWQLPGPLPSTNLVCQHKFYSRLVQKALLPTAVPAFSRLAPTHEGDFLVPIDFPVFVKPVKSFFSVGASRVESHEELRRLTEQSMLPEAFFAPFDILLKEYADLELGHTLLAEEYLRGSQSTLEGYVFKGQPHLLGIVDSIMFPRSISFERFEYPSALPIAAQNKMMSVAQAVMTGIGFDNGLFNIEFMYDPGSDSVKIIEINPRMASQFADLYEKVDGFNSYQVLIDLALGLEPAPRLRQGPYPMAASCVLRTFDNCEVLGLPTTAEIDQLCQRYPGLRVEILATEGKRLSQEMQDGGSFRYGVINIGGNSREHVQSILAECMRNLSFVFKKGEHGSKSAHDRKGTRIGQFGVGGLDVEIDEDVTNAVRTQMED